LTSAHGGAGDDTRGGARTDAHPVTGTCVVHLVWAPTGPARLASFLDSYRRHDADVPHRLLVLFNGLQPDQSLGPWRELLRDVEHEELRLDRPATDLAAYWQVLERVPAERYCFLNSYSVLLADGWLASLKRALDTPSTGVVGATGSWASIRSYQRFMLGLGGYYARVFDDRRATNATLAALATRHLPAEPRRRKHEPLRFIRALLEQSYGFTPFPSAHIRTNGFMIAANVMRAIRVRGLERKADLYRLESGRESITAQVERMGLRALVVGRDGRAYARDEWSSSATLWQSEQENLLIADNRTDDYRLGDSTDRLTLSRYAWGADADPLSVASSAGGSPER
jgi:hypothetical protein